MARRKKAASGGFGSAVAIGLLFAALHGKVHFHVPHVSHNVSASVAAEQHYAKKVFHNDNAQQNCLIALWNAESGWSPYAQNSSGAYGIPQSLGHGHPYNLGDWKAQIRWGARYIHGRWGTPCYIWSIYCVNTRDHPVNGSTGRCWY